MPAEEQLRARLALLDTKITEAYEGPSVSIGGHSLQRQAIQALREERNLVAWQLQQILQGGPFGSVQIKGTNDETFYGARR